MAQGGHALQQQVQQRRPRNQCAFHKLLKFKHIAAIGPARTDAARLQQEGRAESQTDQQPHHVAAAQAPVHHHQPDDGAEGSQAEGFVPTAGDAAEAQRPKAVEPLSADGYPHRGQGHRRGVDIIKVEIEREYAIVPHRTYRQQQTEEGHRPGPMPTDASVAHRQTNRRCKQSRAYQIRHPLGQVGEEHARHIGQADVVVHKAPRPAVVEVAPVDRPRDAIDRGLQKLHVAKVVVGIRHHQQRRRDGRRRKRYHTDAQRLTRYFHIQYKLLSSLMRLLQNPPAGISLITDESKVCGENFCKGTIFLRDSGRFAPKSFTHYYI